MQKVTKAIIALTLSYILFGLYAFGVFLQQPLIKGESLTVQAALEPFVYVSLMVIGNFLIFNAVYSQERSPNHFFYEKKLLAPTIILLLSLAFGAGIHTAGQLIEETFVNTSATNAHVNNFSYQVAFFLEEYPAHFLVAIPYIILLYFLTEIERNRKIATLKALDRIVIVFTAIIFGIAFAVFNAEGGIALIAIPLNIFLLVKFYQQSKGVFSMLRATPFSSYWLIGTMTMTILGIIWGFSNGWLTQPTDLGFGL